MSEIKYRNDDHEESTFETDWDIEELEYIAQDIGEHEYGNGDMNDPDSWPISYEIWSGEKWVKFSVELEYIPSFSARKEDES